MSLLQLNALVAGNGSYILRSCGHDLHGPTHIIEVLGRFIYDPFATNVIDFHWRTMKSIAFLHILTGIRGPNIDIKGLRSIECQCGFYSCIKGQIPLGNFN